jgi:TusA-related sulfurtransferase
VLVSVTLNPLYADCDVDVRLLTFEQAAKEIMRCMIGVAAGESIEIIVSDPTVERQLIEWAKTTGQKILGTSVDSECQRIYLERQH